MWLMNNSVGLAADFVKKHDTVKQGGLPVRELPDERSKIGFAPLLSRGLRGAVTGIQKYVGAFFLKFSPTMTHTIAW